MQASLIRRLLRRLPAVRNLYLGVLRDVAAQTADLTLSRLTALPPAPGQPPFAAISPPPAQEPAYVFRKDVYDHLVLPGVPRDYLDTPVFSDTLAALLKQPEVRAVLEQDDTPLPIAPSREGYYGDRHLEYWLSGYSDAAAVLAAVGLEGREGLRILDLGGASGRVLRHFRYLSPVSELFLSELEPPHVHLTRWLFGGRIIALQNRGVPSLPFPDNYFDCICAFSVFTHIDGEDTAWLMELRRITRPGGHLYLTIHDEATWKALEEIVQAPGHPDPAMRDFYMSERKVDPALKGRLVEIYNSKVDYNCNVYMSDDYLQRNWLPLFRSSKRYPLAHDYQSGLALEVGD